MYYITEMFGRLPNVWVYPFIVGREVTLPGILENSLENPICKLPPAFGCLLTLLSDFLVYVQSCPLLLLLSGFQLDRSVK